MSDASSASGIAQVESELLPRAATKERMGITRTLEQRMKELGIAGVSIAVIDGGEIAWTKAYGTADTVERTPLTSDTLLQAASISKPIAALGALRLVKKGRLSLDADVNSSLRSWRIPASEHIGSSKVTLRQLLSHTGGLSVHGFPGYGVEEPLPTLLQILDGASPANSGAVRMVVPAGEQYRYSGGGYVVLQELVEEQSGEDFASFMQAKVLAEVGMTSSTFSQARLAGVPYAAGHLPGGERISGKARIYPEMAAAGLWTTPKDLARYLIYIQRAITGSDAAILNQALAADMLTRQPESPYGLGPEVYAVGEFARFGHNGVNAGFESAMVAYVQDGKGLVVMANSNRATMLFDEVKGSVARAYQWPGFAIRPQVEVLPIASELASRCEGKYRTADGKIAELVRRRKRMFLSIPEEGTFEVFAKNAFELIVPQVAWKELTLILEGD